ncbi:hypothetical protein [Streptomyces sp. CBMA152]|uniref:hypothetical protein n=1 Tax=Streptomyces sp. CBMA152 TaxID=1896312 RepID=UPI0016615707|nr:hypothetical protein [Streptomyces sp. CBMA152]MBD0742690.1 hypothetical protein [Streptomyces sp. CBMA152]
MLYAFGFERVGVVVGDLYFVNPEPEPGQEGPERGVRIELRMLEPGELKGSIYSARPIMIDRPLWRGDLLESADGPFATFDRTHHHPRFRAWEPGLRVFVEQLTADPLGWVAERLCDLDGLLKEAGVAPDEVGPADSVDLRRTVPQIMDAINLLLEGIRDGRLAQPPGDEPVTEARRGWL